MHTRLLSLVVAVLIVTGTAPLPGRQDPAGQPGFRTGANTVAVYATVTDRAGRLVPDLTREDFEIRDNGRPQPITLFSNDIQPITVVVMLDRSGSMRQNFRLIEAAGEAFVRRLNPEDKARIGSFASRIQIDPEDFTNDQEELVRVLRTELQHEGPTPLWNAVDEAMTSLLPQEGRRVVLVFTDGMDNPMNLRLNNRTVMDVMQRAQQENVMVYAIGLESTMPAPNRGTFRGRGGMLGQQLLTVQRPDPGLALIAEETGGGYFELNRAEDLASTFARVADELHRQYALGFEPPRLDGRMHKVDVRAGRSGLKVRARKSYLAAKP